MSTNPSAARHGVVLLVILGMLAALALIGIAFTTFSAQEENSSENYRMRQQLPRPEMKPEMVMLEGLGQLIAGTNLPHSAMNGHDLLSDMFGNDNDLNLNGRVDSNEYGQRAFNGPGEAGPDGIVGTADDVDFNYVFCGRRPGFSPAGVRIGGLDEDYDYPDHNNMYLAAVRADGTVMVPSFHRPAYLAATDWTSVASSAGTGRRIILRPRGGFGADGQPGVAGTDDDSNGVTDDISERNWPGSDDPEHPLFPATTANGLDVDNMGLGRADSVWLDLGFPVQTTASGRKFKPVFSFVVIDLDGKLNLNAHGQLNYDKIKNDYGSPQFTYPDATGDTTVVPDSHADLAPGASPQHQPVNPPTAFSPVVPFEHDQPLGRGNSPASINLNNVFSQLFFPSVYPSRDPREYQWLLQGRPGSIGVPALSVPYVEGRWGEAELIGTSSPPRAGTTYDASIAGISAAMKTRMLFGSDDDLPGTAGPGRRGNRLEGAPNTTSGGLYDTPPDFDDDGLQGFIMPGGGWRIATVYGPNAPDIQPQIGRGGRFLGWRNMGEADWGPDQVWDNSDDVEVWENLDEASEIDLAAVRGPDHPFTPREIEALYRYEDVDGANLISSWIRLPNLAPSLFDPGMTNRRRRFMLGIGNWDLAAYNMVPLLPRDSTNQNPPFDGSWSSGQSGKFNGRFRDLGDNNLIPEAIRAGRRLNIAPPLRTLADKQRLAREIYVLMMQTCGYSVPADRLAQFAINVVDFQDTEPLSAGSMDRHEVITPFEFDVDFTTGGTGYSCDNDHTSMSGGEITDVVWGAEEPRILISETLAYEDGSNFHFWVELFNNSDRPVNLIGANQTYQLVLSNARPTFEGEPDMSAGSTKTMVFTASGGTTVLNPGDYLIVGTQPIPAKISGSVDRPVGYTDAAFTPDDTGFWRVYVRRLANPGAAEDSTIPFPRSVNPYITQDALDVEVHSDSQFNHPMWDPAVGGYGSVVSFERETLNVSRIEHPDPSVMDGPTHSMGSRNDNTIAATEPLGRFTYFDRPLASPMEVMLVPGVGPQHLTTMYSVPSPAADFYQGQDPPPAPGGADDTYVETGVSRDSAFKNSDSEYLVSYLLNFFCEDSNGEGTGGGAGGPPTTGPGKGKAKGKGTKGKGKGPPSLPPGWAKVRAKRAADSNPTPGYHRFLEFVDVPSRMNGTRDPHFPDPINNPVAGRNRLDRVPGKMNINTIWEQEQFQALLNNHPMSLDSAAFLPAPPTPPTAGQWVAGVPLAPLGSIPAVGGIGGNYNSVTAELWRRVLMSIAHDGTAIPALDGPALPAGDATLFTRDDRPFRSLSMGRPTTATPTATYAPSIHQTLFRGLVVPKVAAAGGSGTSAIFSDERGDAANPNHPPGLEPALIGGMQTLPFNLNAHPLYQWSIYGRLGNLVTTRSNVFAVWMTVGYFEVGNEDPRRLTSIGIANAPPELGPEINKDIGQNVRHRAFFIIDRSLARGYAGPPRTSAELQDILSQVVIYSRIIE